MNVFSNSYCCVREQNKITILNSISTVLLLYELLQVTFAKLIKLCDDKAYFTRCDTILLSEIEIILLKEMVVNPLIGFESVSRLIIPVLQCHRNMTDISCIIYRYRIKLIIYLGHKRFQLKTFQLYILLNLYHYLSHNGRVVVNCLP